MSAFKPKICVWCDLKPTDVKRLYAVKGDAEQCHK